MSSVVSQSTEQKLSPAQALLFVLLVALLGLVAVNFYLLNQRNQQQNEYLALTTDIQVRAQQLAKAAGESAVGNLDAFDELRTTRNTIDRAITVLREGNEATGLPASPDSVNDELATLEDTWNEIDGFTSQIIDRTDLVLELADSSVAFSENIPQLQALSDDVVRAMIETGAPPVQIYVGGRQLVLADRMLRRVGDILAGGTGAITAADAFRADSALFGRVLQGLIEGDSELNLGASRNPRVLDALAAVRPVFEEIRLDVDTILTASTDLFEVREAADQIFLDAADLTDEARALSTGYNNLGEGQIWPSLLAGLVLAGGALFILFLIGFGAYLAQRKRARATADVNQRNQDAILRLLDEMSSLADGDLTVQATVTEDVTGAIADSVNYAVEALRDLVAGVNNTAQQVAAQAQETRATTMQLAEASEHQAREIREATDTINEMAQSFDDMAKRSSESADVAQNSVEIANRGADMVRQTISGMDNIRDQIQETSKRIKRLGESSQEIGDIVELINGISEQTNVLALNAAIQAASAGGAGRGFAVVADEVQRLAERATNATRRIEALVQTIQADTAEAVNSMEQTTSQVVSGARLAEDAGEALESIETVSNDLAGLIQNISRQAQDESRNATKIAQLMNSIRDISVQTTEGTGQTAKSVANLAELVRDLRDSVSDFTLPEDDA
ncbi:methyl-accepting chemotaxis protein [Wenzhouxiangella marina]|uniref:Chemotaxis protein n=1 Tax=Wenzhouxiangella marina TaxID=1579979 RepID=A0A0K0XSZ8_9GAMM|nr:methyl-accepting chemotaxis protein [Wenzhouxiangella marina]AKS40747.1 chemotaxis protein [Wenzhouxiangella marina]MBB6087620.1 twitching motility protein PilJ [Wenzhouxiangella marina]